MRSFSVEKKLTEPEDDAGNVTRTTMWLIRLDDELLNKVPKGDGITPIGVRLPTVAYGKVPKNFVEEVQPKPLVPDVYYQVWALGESPGKGMATAVFKLVEDDGEYRIITPYQSLNQLLPPPKPPGIIPPELEKKAEAGDAEAQYQLGTIYFYGDGVWDDLEKAYDWYLAAANQGHAKAQHMVATLGRYSFVGMSWKESFRWRMKSAEQGYAPAQSDVGLSYSLGDDVPKDMTKAKYWMKKAADQGNIRAARYLGDFYSSGTAEKEWSLAEKYYSMAAAGGCTQGQLRLERQQQLLGQFHSSNAAPVIKKGYSQSRHPAETDPCEETVIELIVEDTTSGLYVRGSTNLPDGTRMEVTLPDATRDFKRADFVKVVNGKFRTKNLNRDGDLVPGQYLMEVSFYPSNQEQVVKAHFGKNYENLKGPLIKKTKSGAIRVLKVMKFTFDEK